MDFGTLASFVGGSKSTRLADEEVIPLDRQEASKSDSYNPNFLIAPRQVKSSELIGQSTGSSEQECWITGC